MQLTTIISIKLLLHHPNATTCTLSATSRVPTSADRTQLISNRDSEKNEPLFKITVTEKQSKTNLPNLSGTSRTQKVHTATWLPLCPKITQPAHIKNWLPRKQQQKFPPALMSFSQTATPRKEKIVEMELGLP